MRIFSLAICILVLIAGLASATPIDLSSATATSNYNTTGYMPNLAIDSNQSTEWVGGLGGLTNGMPWLLINLGQQYNVDSVTVYGVGNSDWTTSFDVFVGTLAALQNIEQNGAGAAGAGATLVEAVTGQADGTAWSLMGSIAPTQTQYVLYEATGTPGWNGQDDAFAAEITADAAATPEPATIGLIGFALLGFGLARRKRT